MVLVKVVCSPHLYCLSFAVLLFSQELSGFCCCPGKVAGASCALVTLRVAEEDEEGVIENKVQEWIQEQGHQKSEGGEERNWRREWKERNIGVVLGGQNFCMVS